MKDGNDFRFGLREKICYILPEKAIVNWRTKSYLIIQDTQNRLSKENIILTPDDIERFLIRVLMKDINRDVAWAMDGKNDRKTGITFQIFMEDLLNTQRRYQISRSPNVIAKLVVGRLRHLLDEKVDIAAIVSDEIREAFK